jgi:hypothetical protein
MGPETEPFTHQRNSRTLETRYHRRTNNWQGYTRTKKNTYMNNTDSSRCTLYSCFHSQISIHHRKTPELCPSVRHANKQPRLNQTDESFEK